MQWSKNVLRKDLAEKAVMDFVPVKLEMGASAQALEYLKNKSEGSDFNMSDVLRIQTGVDKIEKANEEEIIEAKALDKLKEIQEGAYKEAYQLGLDEGRKRAFDQTSAEISEKMQELDKLLLTIKNFKTEMFSFNETHLVQLMFHMASRLTQVYFEQNNSAVVEIMKSAVNLAQDEEKVIVHVAPSQFEFIEELKRQTGREFEFVKKVNFQANPEVSAGGCIVETNYGEVDSRISQRIEQLWQNLGENMPKVKSKISSGTK